MSCKTCLPSRMNSEPTAKPGFTATTNRAARGDSHDFPPHLLGPINTPLWSFSLARYSDHEKRQLHVSRRHKTRYFRCSPRWGEDSAHRYGSVATGSQLRLHVKPRVEPRSAGPHTLDSWSLLRPR